MIEKTIFVVQDGTRFDSEEECLNYELSEDAKGMKGQIFFYDSNFSELPLTAIKEVVYAHILTETAGQWFEDKNKFLGYHSPWDYNKNLPLTGIFWKAYSNIWFELETTYEILKSQIEKIKGYNSFVE